MVLECVLMPGCDDAPRAPCAMRNCTVRAGHAAQLSPHEVLALMPHVTSEPVMPGRLLLREGMVMDSLYVVAKGRLLLVQEEATVGVRFAGETVGEESLLHAGSLAPWSCLAGDWCELMRLHGEAFRALARTHPELGQRLLTHEQNAKHTRSDDLLRAFEHEARQRMCGGCGGPVNKLGTKPRKSSLPTPTEPSVFGEPSAGDSSFSRGRYGSVLGFISRKTSLFASDHSIFTSAPGTPAGAGGGGGSPAKALGGASTAAPRPPLGQGLFEDSISFQSMRGPPARLRPAIGGLSSEAPAPVPEGAPAAAGKRPARKLRARFNSLTPQGLTCLSRKASDSPGSSALARV